MFTVVKQRYQRFGAIGRSDQGLNPCAGDGCVLGEDRKDREAVAGKECTTQAIGKKQVQRQVRPAAYQHLVRDELRPAAGHLDDHLPGARIRIRDTPPYVSIRVVFKVIRCHARIDDGAIGLDKFQLQPGKRDDVPVQSKEDIGDRVVHHHFVRHHLGSRNHAFLRKDPLPVLTLRMGVFVGIAQVQCHICGCCSRYARDRTDIDVVVER